MENKQQQHERYINAQFEDLKASNYLWDILISDGLGNKTNFIKINQFQLEAIKRILKGA
jgi:hypothetical protein